MIEQMIREIELELNNLSTRDPRYHETKELLTEELEILRATKIK